MNITHLKYIVEVERYGSISKAASALYMGQPNLSKIVREVENEFGIPIFKRTARGVVPTEKGREFLQYAKAAISQLDRIDQISKDTTKSDLEFNIMLPRASYITYAFTEFLNSRPLAENIDVSFKETNSLEAIDAVVECNTFLAIIRFELPYEDFFMSLLHEKNIRYTNVWTFDYVVLLSKNSPLAGLEAVTSHDLEDLVEVLHGDTALPDISLAFQKKNLKSNKRHIYVFERGSQFDILSSVPDTFMYVSPLPKAVLDRYGLVQKPCLDKKRTLRDLLIYNGIYRLTSTDKAFLEQLKHVIDDISL